MGAKNQTINGIGGKKEEPNMILCVIAGVCLTGIFIVAVTVL